MPYTMYEATKETTGAFRAIHSDILSGAAVLDVDYAIYAEGESVPQEVLDTCPTVTEVSADVVADLRNE